jgi:tRNA(fMet)-specific endonuclease VapC
MIFLDSSAAIHLMRGELPDAPLRGETLVLSVLVEMELMLGVLHGGRVKEAKRVETFMKQVQVFDFDRPAARKCAEVLADLWSKGKPIGDIDTQIAGHALSLGLPVLTDNTKHFRRVDGLEVIAWSG